MARNGSAPICLWCGESLTPTAEVRWQAWLGGVVTAATVPIRVCSDNCPKNPGGYGVIPRSPTRGRKGTVI